MSNWSKFGQKGISVHNRCNEDQHWILHIRINLDINFHFLDRICSKKVFILKQKSEHSPHWILKILHFGVSTVICFPADIFCRWCKLTLPWKWETVMSNKEIYFICCLIFLSRTTSHRLKKNTFPWRNLNHRNFI